MSGSTVEDFARATLATRGEGEVALRVDSEVWLPWRVRFGADAGGWRSDEGMAATGWTPVAESRITLDSLEAAWEAAERADECGEGDVLIIRDDEHNYLVRRMDDYCDLDSTARILSRAPKPRESWAELAGVLHDEAPKAVVDVDHLAERLHAAGVRVTGGEES